LPGKALGETDGERHAMTCARDAVPPFYHGTRADLEVGGLLAPGFASSYRERTLSWIYFSGTLDAAIWGCELAQGEGRERIYIVAPTGEFEDDPNLTDKRFPGNPTASYRSRDPLRIIGEVDRWEPRSPERLKEMKDFLARLAAGGDMRIID
jgi:rifampin ADP-ribosylating transferase